MPPTLRLISLAKGDDFSQYLQSGAAGCSQGLAECFNMFHRPLGRYFSCRAAKANSGQQVELSFYKTFGTTRHTTQTVVSVIQAELMKIPVSQNPSRARPDEKTGMVVQHAHGCGRNRRRRRSGRGRRRRPGRGPDGGRLRYGRPNATRRVLRTARGRQRHCGGTRSKCARTKARKSARKGGAGIGKSPLKKEA